MKKINLLLMLSIVLMAIGFASCNNSTDYQSVIPNNPVALIKADVGSMIEKSDLLNDNQVTGFLKNGINEMPEGSRELMRSILADPSNSGIDFTQPAFVVIDNIEHLRGFALLAVNDVEKVKNLINTLDDESTTLVSKENYNVLKVSDDNQAAFDESKFIIAFADGSFDATEYITPSETKGNKCSELEKVISSSNDMALYLSYEDIMRLVEGSQPDLMSSADLNKVKDMKFVSTLDFENGKAVLKGSISGADELMSSYKKFIASPESDLQEYLPKASYGFIQSGTKNIGTAIEETLANLPKDNPLHDALDDMNESLERQGFAKFNWSLLNSLDGGIIFSVSERDQSIDMPIPQMALIAECKDQNLFNFIANLVQAEKSIVTKVDENLYSINDFVHFGFADDKIFVMTNKIFSECYQNKSLKALNESLSDNAISNLIGNKNGIIIDTKAVASLMEELGLAKYRDDRAIVNTIRKFNSTHITLDASNYSSEWVLTFDDPNTNSLKQIKDMIVSTAIGDALN